MIAVSGIHVAIAATSPVGRIGGIRGRIVERRITSGEEQEKEGACENQMNTFHLITSLGYRSVPKVF